MNYEDIFNPIINNTMHSLASIAEILDLKQLDLENNKDSNEKKLTLFSDFLSKYSLNR